MSKKTNSRDKLIRYIENLEKEMISIGYSRESLDLLKETGFLQFQIDFNFEALEVLHEYESQFPDMTNKEKKELHRWIYDGNDIYSNPNLLYDERGYPMSFISAYRFEQELYEVLKDMTYEEVMEYMGYDFPDHD